MDNQLKVAHIFALSFQEKMCLTVRHNKRQNPHSWLVRIECSAPDGKLLDIAASQLQVSTYPIVSTDAVYRQTFEKERLWREKGAVGVDMEMSIVFSVSRYLGLKAVGLLMISAIHPLNPGDPKWEWQMTKEMRHELAEKGLSVAQHMRIEQ